MSKSHLCEAARKRNGANMWIFRIPDELMARRTIRYVVSYTNASKTADIEKVIIYNT